MISEVELARFVVSSAKNVERNKHALEGFIATRLLEHLSYEKSCEDHGYFLSVTHLKTICKPLAPKQDYVLFPVVFCCRTFKPLVGEILEGVAYRVCRLGVFLRCGPMKSIFLSARKMPNYHYLLEENNGFFMDDGGTKIAKDILVRFIVLSVRWKNRELAMLASIAGDSLGPISLSGVDELEFSLR